MNRHLRQLPQIDALLGFPAIRALVTAFSRDEVVTALRSELSDLRRLILADALDAVPGFEGGAFAAKLCAAIELGRRSNLIPVVNATGIIIHTNLGRARLAPEAVQDVAASATNLELNLRDGKRGSRYDHVEALICELTGAQAALVV